MYRTATSNRVLGLALTTAMAGALLSGCTTAAAPRADLSASKAEAALAHGKNRQAIAHAEAAVLAAPQDASYRVTLANAYLGAGRFASAETTFNDALALGDSSPRTALSLALALMGEGKLREAGALLNQWEDRIAPGDLGLALALSGQADRGIDVMSNAIRGGNNDVRIRQNLAYAYALGGRWREARLMAAQDVPPDKLGERIEQWAMMAQPEAWHLRIATLLDVPAGAGDAGQPVELALANNPSLEQLAAQAVADNAVRPAVELPPVQVAAMSAASSVSVDPALVAEAAQTAATLVLEPAPARPAELPSFQQAFAAPAAPALAAVTQDSALFVSEPVVQSLPAALAAPASRRAAPVVAQAQVDSVSGTHLIQLGSFSSEQGAKRAWSIYQSKYPELAGHQMVISEAVVRGKHYWRVSAGGFGRAASSSMCGKVKSGGEGCFAYAEGRPLPGAIDTGIRLARR